jgi:hypothetical protein
MVDLGVLGFTRDQSAVTGHAMVEDSLVKYLKFERVRGGGYFRYFILAFRGFF